MNTINFELSKRLNDLGLLNDINSEYVYCEIKYGENKQLRKLFKRGEKLDLINIKAIKSINTLTPEEAIEFLLNKILSIDLFNRDGEIRCGEGNGDGTYKKGPFIGKTLLEAIEKMLEYLLDNNLLTK